MTDDPQKPDSPSEPLEPTRPPDAWELVCAGILRTEFGRQPTQAVNKAMIRLAAEEAAASSGNRPAAGGWHERLQRWLGSWQPRTAYAVCTIAILGASFAIYHFLTRSANFGPATVAESKITDAIDLHWANNSPRLKIGSQVPAGWLKLESGVVEITFASSAKAAVEGPAQFQITGYNSIELQSGKTSTDVPRRAKGFSLKTPTATVTDLGTRFGAIVGGDKSSEVDVFQGRVQLRTADGSPNDLRAGQAMLVDNSGATAANALPESAFPEPNLAVEVRPQNCGFDSSGRAAVGEVPVNFGYWSGTAYSLTGPTRGVTPGNGPGMLEFYNSSSPHEGNSEVWQIVDLRPYKTLLAGGAVRAKLTALFNRVAGDAPAPNKFGLAVAAFHGSPADARQLWADRQSRSVALADKELASDNNPETWEELETEAKLPPTTDFVIVQIRALAPPGNPSALAGHFADRVDLWLNAPMRASSLAIK